MIDHASRPTSTEREARGPDSPIRQFVGFRLDDADYAIPITSIREIILMKPITRLPEVADSIEGLINLRGNVMPLINLRKRFGLAARPFDDETRTIVVTVHDKILGCIVDEVTRVVRGSRATRSSRCRSRWPARRGATSRACRSSTIGC